jgi:hypothetical protein
MLAPSFAAAGKTIHRFTTAIFDSALATENRLWGAPRIHGELLKLGIAVSVIRSAVGILAKHKYSNLQRSRHGTSVWTTINARTQG